MEKLHWQLVLLSFVVTFLDVAGGSIILMSGSPSVVKEGLTETATLRCSLNDTASQSNTIVGRRDVIDSSQIDDVITRRDVSVTSENVAQVMSIIVTKNGTDVAAVSKTNPAKVIDPAADANLRVAGGFSDASTERGFLELQWSDPTSAQTGDYVCEINTIDAIGHSVTFSTHLSFDIASPSVPDLVEHIRQIKADASLNNATANARISQLEAKIQSNNQADSSRMSTIEARMAQLESAIQAESKKNADLEVKLANVGHIETGRLSTISHPSGYGSRSQDVKQVFKTPYSKIPQVVLGTTRLDESSNSDNIRFEVYVISVDTKGFTARFNTWSSNVITSWTVDWISVPAHV